MAGDDALAPGEIVITSGQITSLKELFARTRQRPPSDQEISALINDYIHDEVFYREAQAMGLDRDDVVIRRRMRQKTELLAEEIASGAE